MEFLIAAFYDICVIYGLSKLILSFKISLITMSSKHFMVRIIFILFLPHVYICKCIFGNVTLVKVCILDILCFLQAATRYLTSSQHVVEYLKMCEKCPVKANRKAGLLAMQGCHYTDDNMFMYKGTVQFPVFSWKKQNACISLSLTCKVLKIKYNTSTICLFHSSFFSKMHCWDWQGCFMSQMKWLCN